MRLLNETTTTKNTTQKMYEIKSEVQIYKIKNKTVMGGVGKRQVQNHE